MLHAYIEREKGYLPNAGGWLDQPMKFTDSMKFIEIQKAMIKDNDNAK
jgi:hypothetical protein